jgi:putative tricarboxylic transport membrane protein
MLGALTIQGIQPGPEVMTLRPDLFWGLIASMWIGNLMLVVLNLPLVGIWVQLLRIPRPQLYAGILVFAMIGVWGLAGSWVDLTIMLVVGLGGYVMRVYDFPIAPVLIGLILGPMAETQLRTALAAGQGNPMVMVSTPLSAILITLAVPLLALPILLKRLRANA